MNRQSRSVRWQIVCAVVVAVLAGWCEWAIAAETTPLSDYLIGYREFRTNLPAGRFANVATTRAYVVRADGTGRREFAPELVTDANTFTTFVYPSGWSPDGKTAIIGNGRNTPENGAREEAEKTFHFEGWQYDMYLVDVATGKMTNVSAPGRLSNYNNGLGFWPGNPKKLLGTALINGLEHPIAMDVDGRNKVDLTSGSVQYTYGASVAPDGKHISYHSGYQIYIADPDGSNPRHIATPNSFNFGPQWSSDSKWLMFLSGEHMDANVYVVRADGTELRKLADRNKHATMSVMDVPDYHGGSSDVPVWSSVDSSIYFAAKVDQSVELMRMKVNGPVEQLTHSDSPGTMNYMPVISPDGKWILFGSTRSGPRQLYVMSADGGEAHAITTVPPGSGAMFGCWNPVPQPASKSK